MTHKKKSFAGAGIGIIIFILCYRLLPPPEGSSLSFRAFWLLACPLGTSGLGLIIFGIAGLISRSITVFLAGLSSFILFASVIYASCCFVFSDELKAIYTKIYIKEERAERVEKRDKAIRKAIEENIEEQKKIPKPAIEQKPLKLVFEKAAPEKNENAQKPITSVKTISPKHDDGSGSPFDYGADELGGYIPIKGQHMIPDVSIKGILTLENGESVAALQLKNKKRSFYVRKGNVIRIQDKKENKKLSEIYLQVREIKENEVEIIQQQRPDKVIIIR